MMTCASRPRAASERDAAKAVDWAAKMLEGARGVVRD